MPKVTVERKHNLSKEELEKKADEFIKDFAKKMASVKMEYTWRPDKSGIDFKGKGFKGTVELTSDKITLMVDLSLMLAPFKGTVEEQANKQLDKMLS